MPRNAQGVYSLPTGNPVVTGTTIDSTWANPTLSDIATEITASLPRNGNAGMTGPLILAADATVPLQAATLQQMEAGDTAVTDAFEAADTAITGAYEAADTAITGAYEAADNLKANIASPTFTGIPAGPTAALGTNTTQIATTAFVKAASDLKANIASPTFTGVPLSTTPGTTDNTTKIATTSFVNSFLSSKMTVTTITGGFLWKFSNGMMVFYIQKTGPFQLLTALGTGGLYFQNLSYSAPATSLIPWTVFGGGSSTQTALFLNNGVGTTTTYRYNIWGYSNASAASHTLDIVGIGKWA